MGTQFFVVSHWGSVKSATRFAVPLALIRISYYAWPSHLGQVRVRRRAGAPGGCAHDRDEIAHDHNPGRGHDLSLDEPVVLLVLTSAPPILTMRVRV
jgi:hypothetical protein